MADGGRERAVQPSQRVADEAVIRLPGAAGALELVRRVIVVNQRKRARRFVRAAMTPIDRRGGDQTGQHENESAHTNTYAPGAVTFH